MINNMPGAPDTDCFPIKVEMPTIISCDSWGAILPTEPLTVLNTRPTKIIIHHTNGMWDNTTDYSIEHACHLAQEIQELHISNGWSDSGQHFTISRGGYILEGRHHSLDELHRGVNHVLGAHCLGQNDVAVGIENEGNYIDILPPEVLYNQMVILCAYICQQYNISSDNIYAHKDFNVTQCPGDQLYMLLELLRQDVSKHLVRRGTNFRV